MEVSGRWSDDASPDALTAGVRKSERPCSAGVYGRDGSERDARACAMVLYCEERGFHPESPSIVCAPHYPPTGTPAPPLGRAYTA